MVSEAWKPTLPSTAFSRVDAIFRPPQLLHDWCSFTPFWFFMTGTNKETYYKISLLKPRYKNTLQITLGRHITRVWFWIRSGNMPQGYIPQIKFRQLITRSVPQDMIRRHSQDPFSSRQDPVTCQKTHSSRQDLILKSSSGSTAQGAIFKDSTQGPITQFGFSQLN